MTSSKISSIDRAASPHDGIKAMVDRFLAAYRERHYATLFYSLLITLAWSPLIRLLHLRIHLMGVFLGFNLLAAVFPIRNRKQRWILLAVLLAVGLLRAPLVSQSVPGMDTVNLSLQISVALLAAVTALRFALSGLTISREHLYAALSAYILMGVFAGVFYSVLEHSWPGSFAIAGQPAHGQFPLSTATYFSFVTLTTLGYGDIVPISEAARGIVVFESIAGQLYLVVMVARLVSLYVVGELQKGS